MAAFCSRNVAVASANLELVGSFGTLEDGQHPAFQSMNTYSTAWIKSQSCRTYEPHHVCSHSQQQGR